MPDKYQTYKSNAIKRKLWLSKTMLLFYRTGFDIFPLRMEDVEATPSFLLTATMRGRGRNIWANTRIAGVAAMADTLCCVHCLYPDVGKLLFADELGAFTRNTTPLKAQRQAFVFIGNSYGEMIGELEKPSDSNAARLITYGEAYRRLQLEACIVSCDAVGVTQLRLLSQPNYRTRLTRSILRSHYAPAPEGADYDAVFQGAPFLLALDMDLRRVDALCRNQREQNAMQPAIAALEEQATSVLNARYRDTGLARVFTLTEKTLRTFLPPLPDKAAQPFLTPKGDVIHAPLIRT